MKFSIVIRTGRDALPASTLDKLTSIPSVGIGLCFGYINAQGLPSNLEDWALLAPAVIQGGMGMMRTNAPRSIDDACTSLSEGVRGVVTGSIQTMFGYGIGYALGYIIRN